MFQLSSRIASFLLIPVHFMVNTFNHTFAILIYLLSLTYHLEFDT